MILRSRLAPGKAHTADAIRADLVGKFMKEGMPATDRQATCATRARSAGRRSVSASARVRSEACWRSRMASAAPSEALANVPPMKTIHSEALSCQASNCVVLRTRYKVSRPGSDSLRSSTKRPTRVAATALDAPVAWPSRVSMRVLPTTTSLS